MKIMLWIINEKKHKLFQTDWTNPIHSKDTIMEVNSKLEVPLTKIIPCKNKSKLEFIKKNHPSLFMICMIF